VRVFGYFGGVLVLLVSIVASGVALDTWRDKRRRNMRALAVVNFSKANSIDEKYQWMLKVYVSRGGEFLTEIHELLNNPDKLALLEPQDAFVVKSSPGEDFVVESSPGEDSNMELYFARNPAREIFERRLILEDKGSLTADPDALRTLKKLIDFF